jgi:hypothetical protein
MTPQRRTKRPRGLPVDGAGGTLRSVSVLPLPPRGEWFADARDGGRAMRVSWHAEAGCVVLSTWRDESCVATTRLTPDDAARLIGTLARGLAAGAAAAGQQGDVESA